MSNSANIIEVQDLCKSFHGHVAVNHINLDVKRGEVFGFLGPNGSGKTTTIRMLCGLLTPDNGSGHCLGYDIITESEFIKAQVGYLTQKFSLYQDLTVSENLFFMGKLYSLPNLKNQVVNIMQEMELEPRKNQLTKELSGGWKQRLALACCLLHKPKLLLLDEPTAGVDPLARRTFWDKIHALSEQGITTLVSTHYMDEAERCTRLAYISLGNLLITGTANDVIKTTKLVTWTIKGHVTTSLLSQIKTAPGVIQAALFGNQIHVSGFDIPLIEKILNQLTLDHNVRWERIDTTLEDAFISLVSQSRDR